MQSFGILFHNPPGWEEYKKNYLLLQYINIVQMQRSRPEFLQSIFVMYGACVLVFCYICGWIWSCVFMRVFLHVRVFLTEKKRISSSSRQNWYLNPAEEQMTDGEIWKAANMLQSWTSTLEIISLKTFSPAKLDWVGSPDEHERHDVIVSTTWTTFSLPL